MVDRPLSRFPAEASFPRRQESRNPAFSGTERLDARLRGHDGLGELISRKPGKIASNEKTSSYEERGRSKYRFGKLPFERRT